ncbi:MAG: hypothetical protein DF168_00260 [Candidatus Moanabacter tarae]|uniref:MIP18 family-like domain-containing protein n=1 Tax=Candidatus Moanibacter tarae TaxID=2200854 RepID=A0A2Z4AG73_9BACT|nr:MAG: hypothetical protein DF168_00260 [Candidatus Moanabacter tarae]
MDIQCDISSNDNASVILDCLDKVSDPELDESVLELGFIRNLRVSDGRA